MSSPKSDAPVHLTPGKPTENGHIESFNDKQHYDTLKPQPVATVIMLPLPDVSMS